MQSKIPYVEIEILGDSVNIELPTEYYEAASYVASGWMGFSFRATPDGSYPRFLIPRERIPQVLARIADEMRIRAGGSTEPVRDPKGRLQDVPARRTSRTTQGIVETAISFAERLSEDTRRALWLKSTDDRLNYARDLITHLRSGLDSYTEAQSQLCALMILRSVNERHMKNAFMSDFTERLREELSIRVSSFGDKAYPLSEKQFAAAVKAAW